MDAHKALALWLSEGLIGPELEDRLKTRLEQEETSSRSNATVSFFVSVGALLVGGGLFLFIASRWERQSPLNRLLLLFGAYLVAVAAAWLADRQSLATVAKGLWFLATLVVGVNIFLTGQIFNLPLNYWQGTFLWLIAALAVGRVAPSFPLGWLVVGLGVLTVGWLSIPESQFFDQGAFLIEQAGIRPLLPVIGLALLGGALLLDGTEVEYLIRPARVVGVLFIAVPLVVSTFHPEAFAVVFQIDFRLFHAFVIAAAALIVGLAWARSQSELLVYGLGGVLALSLALLPQGDRQAGAGRLDEFDSLPWLAEPFGDSQILYLLYGALIFGLALATVMAGRRYEIRAMVNIGLIALGVILFAAYVGRLAGELPTSVAFLLGGVLLVAIAIVVERKRRDLAADAEVPS
jgi:uncharacterized membrane protein